jgi:NADH dehydrogenase
MIMKVAITGGTGFVGRNLARALVDQGHEVVLIARGVDDRELGIRQLPHAIFCPIGTADAARLEKAFQGCDAVAHMAGINREIGDQTYADVHVQGTQNVVDAAQKAGVKKIIFLSFLRARPNCDSGYHESKWAAEEIVRNSGLDYTIFKAGVIYGSGDHMLDHISHALYTFPVFFMVGFQDKPVAPLAIEDLARVLVASVVDGRMQNQTVAITGPEKINLRQVVRRICDVVGKHPWTMRAPIWVHYCLAWFFEQTMKTPLAAFAQVRILSESLTDPYGEVVAPPADLVPTTPFTDAQIRKGLPAKARFGMRDCLLKRSQVTGHR